MDVLEYLAARPGVVISKIELKSALWPSEFVVDEAVRRCISQIRKAFADDAVAPSYVETVPKRGYRLIGEVRPLQNRQQSRVFRASAVAASLLSLLIAPILASTPDFSGSKMPDGLDLHAIAEDEYSQYDSDGIESAIKMYEFLIALDANDASAYAGLANSLMQSYLRTQNDISIAEKARAAALRARQLDPDSPAAHKALGSYYHFQGKRQRALQSYADAVRIDPNYWNALNNGAEILRDVGDYSTARKLFECALDTTTNKVDVLVRLAGVEIRDGQMDKAKIILDSVSLIDPKNTEVALLLSYVDGRASAPLPKPIHLESANHDTIVALIDEFRALDCGRRLST